LRTINELIWHYTATPADREVTIAEVRGWHKARGWTDVGYHKLVHLDGTVSEGRSDRIQGAHTAGKNKGTLGYCYVGGTLEDPNVGLDTRTPAQKATMLRLTQEAIQKYNLQKVSGHRDHGATQCPGFDARSEYQSLFPSRQAGMPSKDPADNSAEKKGGVLGVSGVALEASQAIFPFADISEIVTYIAVSLVVAGVGLYGYSQYQKKS